MSEMSKDEAEYFEMLHEQIAPDENFDDWLASLDNDIWEGLNASIPDEAWAYWESVKAFV